MSIEPYNMTQAQRDAAHIAALEKQVQDLSAVVKALACNKTNLDIRIHAVEIEQTADLRALCDQYSKHASHEAGVFILKELAERGALYHRLAQYEQWFYAKNNYTSRMDALRSTMTTAR